MKPAPTDPPEVHRRLWDGYQGDVGFDIGANCGQTLPEMMSRFKSVIAFEPAEECWPYLEDFGGNITYLPIAVSDADTNINLIAIPDKISTGQLVSTEAQGMEYDPTSDTAVNRLVIARTIDSLLERYEVPNPDFMKIDVEGHEHRVLFGARKTLATHRPDLLIEFHSKDLHAAVRDTLETLGYATETVRHPHYQPGTDLWFTHGWIRAICH